MYIGCSLRDSQNFFMQPLLLYTSHLFYMPLYDNIVGMEKFDKIFSPNFVVDEIPGLFLHPSVFSIKNSRSP